jgi:hypothetical protein
MILDNYPFVRIIFQKGTNYVHTFIIGCFYFELLQFGTDSCIYRVRLGGFRTVKFFFFFYATSPYNYSSNVDFVHFIWDNFERVSSRKLAITILPSDSVPLPLNLSFSLPATTRLLYLQYYRATSDGLWLDRHICDECILKHKMSLKIFLRVAGLMLIALVLLVRDSLLPYDTYDPTFISETQNVLN